MISTIILTKNEEKNIIDCVESVLFCDEIIIVDDESTDRTKDIIQRLSKEHEKIKYFSRKLNKDFSAQRQFGIEKCKNDWIFFVDADERITSELKNEIVENISENQNFGGFLIPRIDFMWGKKLTHGETGNIKLLRLFNKNEGKLTGIVHETWQTERPVGRLLNSILHYPHQTFSEFLNEINFYTDLRAEELHNKNVKVSFLSILFYPMAKFLMNYFLKFGFMDGIQGLIHGIIMSFHSFLVRGKLWLLWQKK
jgi:glycosyltransferase involved in cell wall biosynthesis